MDCCVSFFYVELDCIKWVGVKNLQKFEGHVNVATVENIDASVEASASWTLWNTEAWSGSIGTHKQSGVFHDGLTPSAYGPGNGLVKLEQQLHLNGLPYCIANSYDEVQCPIKVCYTVSRPT